MWLFTNKGFVSIVQDFQIPGNVLVRARSKKHLQDLFPDQEVQVTPLADYRFRVSLPQAQIADRVREWVAGIDYTNFKDSIPDDEYHDATLDVWRTMFAFQSDQVRKGKRT